jgi:hypothetical protein
MATAPKKSYREQTLDIISSSNLVAMNAAIPKLRVATSNLGSDTLGLVDSRIPRTMIINENLADPRINSGIKHTIPHEFEHVLQNMVGERYDRSYDSLVVDEYKKLGGNLPKLTDQLAKSAASQKLRSRLEEITGTPVAAYFGKPARPGDYSLKEQFAELSSIESATKTDLTKDPVVRKEFFGDDQALIDVYKATTGNRMTRMDAKDLPPMSTTAPAAESMLDKIVNLVRGAIQ